MTGPEARGAAEGLGGTIDVVPKNLVPESGASTFQMMARVGLASVLGFSVIFTVQEARAMVATCEGASQTDIQTVTNDLAAAEQQHILQPQVTSVVHENTRTITYSFGDTSAVFHEPLLTHKEGYAMSGQQLLDYTSNFVSSYGLTLSVMTETEREQLDASTATVMDPIQLDTLSTKTGLLAIMDGLAGLPESYVHASNVEHMYIIGDEPHLSAAAQPYGEHDIVLFNLRVPLDPRTVGHELTHSWDRWVACGTTRKQLQDTQYTRHNQNDIYDHNYDDATEEPYSLDAIFSETARGSKYLQAASLNPSVRYQLISQIEVVSDYSYTNPAEDKAEMVSALAYDTSHGMVFSKYMPRLRNKAIELLARIKTTSKGFYDYLIYRYQQDIAELGE